MAQVVTGYLKIDYNAPEQLVYGGVPPTSAPLGNPVNGQLTYGTGNAAAAGSINLHFEQSTAPITLAASASQTFTLSSLTDGLGRTFSMAGGVRMLLIHVITRTAGDFLTYAPGATHGWTAITSGTTKIFDLFALGVGQTDRYAVVPGTNDQFTITNGGSHSITFEIAIAGCDS